ncbi:MULTISPECIES: hypothetical protein [unclassified Chelatococcus]|uniref:hypothetical protein n=1 Tax=unclassified Chelatococcus TaxID=2638111 RepID=UPI0020C0A94E|nr:MULTISPECIES: hypothetical protein [unclassified Chelatococcus]
MLLSKAALEEARHEALEHRFGSSDPRDFAKMLEQHPELAKRATGIVAVARTINHARVAELSRDHTLQQELSRRREIGLGR